MQLTIYDFVVDLLFDSAVEDVVSSAKRQRPQFTGCVRFKRKVNLLSRHIDV